MWKTINLTNASPDQYLSFNGRGSLFTDGTLDSGTVRIYVAGQSQNNGPKVYSSGFIYEMDATTKTADVPSGNYKFSLVGDNGSGDVTIYYSGQKVSVS